ncbi:MAG: hypothetical protein KF901_15760 [Myxococcales bacterium]|nr:hypothetical protein [Myxococcales bacterium]
MGALCAVSAMAACGDDEVPTVEARILVTEVTGGEPDVGAEVCVTEPAGYGCAIADTAGYATLTVPAERDVAFRATHPDRTPTVFSLTTRDTDVEVKVDTAEPTLVQILLLGIGLDANPSAGLVLVLARGATGGGADAQGMTFALGAGDGPFYFESSQPMPALTETSMDGAVAFANVPPGSHTLTAAGAARCETVVGSDRGADSTGIRVEAGALTFVRLGNCVPR